MTHNERIIHGEDYSSSQHSFTIILLSHQEIVPLLHLRGKEHQDIVNDCHIAPHFIFVYAKYLLYNEVLLCPE